MTHPKSCEISQTAAGGKVDELAMLVRQLAQPLRKAAPGNELKRRGLAGTLLRGDMPNAQLDPPSSLKPSKACGQLERWPMQANKEMFQAFRAFSASCVG